MYTGPTPHPSGMRRITKEFEKIQNDSQDFEVTTDANVPPTWNIKFKNLEESKFTNGEANALLYFPPEYPFKPPRIQFIPGIVHPNVTDDFIHGYVFANDWKPFIQICDVIRNVHNMLKCPIENPTAHAARLATPWIVGN